MDEVEKDLDPDQNFVDQLVHTCCYYTNNQFDVSFRNENAISIVYFNAGSMYRNFEHITDDLKKFRNTFTAITITETWITMERGTDSDMDGYEFKYINRKNKRSRGVALYIRNTFQFDVTENMTTTNDDVMECLTVEIYCGKKHYQLCVQTT